MRVDGDWEGWFDFFLDGVAAIADEAVASARELFALVAADRARVLAHEGGSVVALRLFELLPRHPVVTVASVMKFVETTKPTAGRAIELLVAADVLVETTGKKRGRSFVYRGYLVDSASAPSSTAHREPGRPTDERRFTLRRLEASRVPVRRSRQPRVAASTELQRTQARQTAPKR